MRYGIYVPNCGGYGSVRDIIELAERAEASGWDGFFIWDVLTAGGGPVADAQITLSAVAMSTRTIALGALVTPLGRRRPWKLAREIAALAEISRGRVVVGCSVGDGLDFAFPGEVQTAGERVARFTDAVEILRMMLSGSRVEWTQSAHTARALGHEPESISAEPFLPAPSSQVPFWGGASVQRKGDQRTAPFMRAARILDGLFPVAAPWDNRQPITLAEFARAIDYAFEGAQPPAGFDLIACGRTGGNISGASDPARFAAEGATWWLEAFPTDASPREVRPLIEAGPPRA